VGRKELADNSGSCDHQASGSRPDLHSIGANDEALPGVVVLVMKQMSPRAKSLYMLICIRVDWRVAAECSNLDRDRCVSMHGLALAPTMEDVARLKL
jgi:hypothetical protein